MSPIRPENRARYPKDWKRIRSEIVARAEHRCEFCGTANGARHPETRSVVVLTVAHLDHTPENNDPENLRALCQRCHLRYDQAEHIKNARLTREQKSGQLAFFCEPQTKTALPGEDRASAAHDAFQEQRFTTASVTQAQRIEQHGKAQQRMD